jgi:hypothetical protein
MTTITQLSLLDDEKQTVKVEIYRLAPDRWQAMIAGGRWMAMGKTRAQAIRRVKAFFENEMNY